MIIRSDFSKRMFSDRRMHIFSSRFGSHLYGTDTELSDVDTKVVFVPGQRELLLGYYKDTAESKIKPFVAGQQRKNEPGEDDLVSISIRKMIMDVSIGKPEALDLLFATPLVLENKLSGHCFPHWKLVWDNREKLFCKQSARFLGYCRNQANKYGIKGSRRHAAKLATEFFAEQVKVFETDAPAGLAYSNWIMGLMKNVEHCRIVEIKQPNDKMLKHYECCGRKVPFTARMKTAFEVFQKLDDNYGQRARAAENNAGVDWKAMSHAIRVGQQACEYLRYGHITFPRPNADYLLAIKKGERDFKAVAEWLDALLADVEHAANECSFQDKPDPAFIEELICEIHHDLVVK